MRIERPAAHAVAGKLEINGPLEAVGRGEAAVDLAKRRQWIVEQRGSDRNFLENLPLRVEIADAVVQQRIRPALVDSRSAADHDHGRFLRIGAGNGVGDAQTPDAVREAHGSHAVDAGVPVGRIARAIFPARADHADRTLFKHPVELEHKIARDAEDVANAVILQAPNQVFADRGGRSLVACRAAGGSQGKAAWFLCAVLSPV